MEFQQPNYGNPASALAQKGQAELKSTRQGRILCNSGFAGAGVLHQISSHRLLTTYDINAWIRQLNKKDYPDPNFEICAVECCQLIWRVVLKVNKKCCGRHVQGRGGVGRVQVAGVVGQGDKWLGQRSGRERSSGAGSSSVTVSRLR